MAQLPCVTQDHFIRQPPDLIYFKVALSRNKGQTQTFIQPHIFTSFLSIYFKQSYFQIKLL